MLDTDAHGDGNIDKAVYTGILTDIVIHTDIVGDTDTVIDTTTTL